MSDLRFVELEPALELGSYFEEDVVLTEAVHRELSRTWSTIPEGVPGPDFALRLTVEGCDLEAFAPVRMIVGQPDLSLPIDLRRRGDDSAVLLPLSYNSMSQLWGVSFAGPLVWKDCVFENDQGEPLDAVLDRDRVEAAFDLVAKSIPLGAVATNLFPPVFLQEFWGPRNYGQLDAHLAHLSNMNLVSAELKERAHRPDARNNWAVLIPEALKDNMAMREALSPLIAHRGGEVLVLDGGHPGAAIDKFGMAVCNRPTEDRPYYLMVVGDLDDISMESMYLLQSFGGTGRLPFTDPAAIATYVEKLLAFERSLPDDRPSACFVAADRDDTNAANFTGLVEPLMADLEKAGVQLKLRAFGTATASKAVEDLRLQPRGSIGFLSAHGHEYLTGHRDLQVTRQAQEALQGALVFDDFESATTTARRQGLLTAEDAAKGRFLEGGIAIMHACYSAGTIMRDTMPEWVHLPMRNRMIPEAPFTSALAKALLLNPQGPVALFAHINRSYQYDYFHPAAEGDSVTKGAYAYLLGKLVEGYPVGLGREQFRSLAIDYMSQIMTISHQLEMKITGMCAHGMRGTVSKPIEAYEQAFMQYSFATCNFRNYVILGDPLARLSRPRTNTAD